jgi:GNAT superfamily N-acetyltransferase
MGRIKVSPVKERNVDEVASLAVDSFQEEQKRVPILRPSSEQIQAFLPRLKKLVKEVPSVAAFEDGRLAGFLTGFTMPSWRGRKTVYCPEWAHAAVGENRKEAYQLMYAAMSKKWAENQCATHLITHFAHDGEAIETFSWFGFGMASVDAVRDLSPIEGVDSSVKIRKATIDDLETATTLNYKLREHLAGAPIFLVSPEETGSHSRKVCREWLFDASKAFWIAFKDGRAVAFMAVGPVNEDVPLMVQDESVSGILGAFTEKKFRGQGIGKALLNRSIEWASSKGYEACAVDFESENPEGSRFWMKHFKPIFYTLVRNLR